MNVALLGVFTAQAAFVLLSIVFLMLAAALLALVLDQAAGEVRPADALVLQPALARPCPPDPPLRSSIRRYGPAPSRAPPTFPLRHSWIINPDDARE